jgi:hypothetical protein
MWMLVGEKARALQQWHKAQATECLRLPCLHPVEDEFQPKRLLRMVQRALGSSTSQHKSGSGSDTSQQQQQQQSVSSCSFCQFGGALPLRRCCGTTVYCDAQCQKRDRK